MANRIRGARAKAEGALFERILQIRCKGAGIHFEQLPSGARWIGKTAIPAKVPFDFIVAKNGRAVFFDAKSTSGKTFSRSACSPHQIDSLSALEASGLLAGFLVWLRELDEVVFFRASQLKGLPPRVTLKAQDGKSLGIMKALSMESLFDERATAEL